MTGSYDQNLSILSVNNLLLHSIGYTFDAFMEQTKGSLKNFFYDKEYILERDRLLQLHGTGEAQILAADGTVKNVRLCKALPATFFSCSSSRRYSEKCTAL